MFALGFRNLVSQPCCRNLVRAAPISFLRSASTLVFAQHNNAAVDGGTLSTVTAASKLSGDVTVLVAGGKGSEQAAKHASRLSGVSQVLHVQSDLFDKPVAEELAALLVNVQKNSAFTHIFSPSTTVSKNFLPRAAALLDVQAISEVIDIKDENTFVRPIYAGNAIATVKSNDSLKVCTIRSTAFEKAEEGESETSIQAFDSNVEKSGTSWEGEELSKSERPDLTTAKIVVSGGRALKSSENFKIIEDLCSKLNAAMGASRAAVDAGYVPNDLQVGQTGKIVAPELYIAVGISGAIQHLAGMKDSKVIVAINKDAEAPIFQVADYGLVADLFKAVPEMTEKFSQQQWKR